MNLDAKVMVCGARGLVGSAIVRRLGQGGYRDVLAVGREDVDLQDAAAVEAYFQRTRPDCVFVAAARVGGILANSRFPVDFLEQNLRIELNTIASAYRAGAKKLVFLGSSCIYPKLAPQPIREDSLLTGPLEPTNEWYAIAKIAGIKLGQAYRQQYGFNVVSAMPTNLYGPGDNFDLESSHVLPALIRKFHEAKRTRAAEVEIWGTGTVRREFLHVDDAADAMVFLMERYDGGEIVNVGTGEDLTIRDLAGIVQRAVGFEGALRFDTSKPDGTPRKQLDMSKLSALGWSPRIPLEEGIRATYAWYLENGAAR